MSTITVNGTTITQELIKTEEFIHIASPSIWDRNTRYSMRVSKARGAHLKGAISPGMVCVALAEYPDGRREKLDGNSRSESIKDGLLCSYPEYLLANVFKVKNEAEVNELFLTFDSKSAVDTTADELQYAYNKKGLSITSKLLATAASTSIKIAASSRDIYIAVHKMQRGIDILDGMKLSKTSGVDRALLSSGPMAALVRICDLKGYRALPAIASYLEGSGSMKELTDSLSIPKKEEGHIDITSNGACVKFGMDLVYSYLLEEVDS